MIFSFVALTGLLAWMVFRRKSNAPASVEVFAILKGQSIVEPGEEIVLVATIPGRNGAGAPVHWSTLHFSPGDAKHQIVLDMTPDEIKAAPAYRDPDKPAPVVTPAAVIPVAGTTGNPAQAEPSPH